MNIKVDLLLEVLASIPETQPETKALLQSCIDKNGDITKYQRDKLVWKLSELETFEKRLPQFFSLSPGGIWSICEKQSNAARLLLQVDTASDVFTNKVTSVLTDAACSKSYWNKGRINRQKVISEIGFKDIPQPVSYVIWDFLVEDLLLITEVDTVGFLIQYGLKKNPVPFIENLYISQGGCTVKELRNSIHAQLPEDSDIPSNIPSDTQISKYMSKRGKRLKDIVNGKQILNILRRLDESLDISQKLKDQIITNHLSEEQSDTVIDLILEHGLATFSETGRAFCLTRERIRQKRLGKPYNPPHIVRRNKRAKRLDEIINSLATLQGKSQFKEVVISTVFDPTHWTNGLYFDPTYLYQQFGLHVKNPRPLWNTLHQRGIVDSSLDKIELLLVYVLEVNPTYYLKFLYYKRQLYYSDIAESISEQILARGCLVQGLSTTHVHQFARKHDILPRQKAFSHRGNRS